VLYQKLRHHLPGLARRGVGVMGPVNLKHPGAGHQGLGLGGVNKGPHHAHVAVEDVVLGVLVGPADPFLGKENGNLWTRHPADIGVKVDGAPHLVLNDVKGLASGPQLLAGYGDAAHPLGRTLNQAVEVALAGGADHHDVVGAVPGGHPHPADVILKAPRGDLRGDDLLGLRVNPPEVLGRRQGYRVLQRRGRLQVHKLTHPGLRVTGIKLPPPAPPPLPRPVVLQVVEDLLHIQSLFGLNLHPSGPPLLHPSSCPRQGPGQRRGSRARYL